MPLRTDVSNVFNEQLKLVELPKGATDEIVEEYFILFVSHLLTGAHASL